MAQSKIVTDILTALNKLFPVVPLEDVNGGISAMFDTAEQDILANPDPVPGSALATHAALTGSEAHGAVSAPTASEIITRDENGRAQVEDPEDGQDIATLHWVESNPYNYLIGITSTMVEDALGYTPLEGVTGAMVEDALGFAPYDATNPAGYITSSASITGSAGSVANALTIGSGLTGSESSFNGSQAVTVSLSQGYGDTVNPYASKAKGLVLATPASGSGAPSFRALALTDLPAGPFVYAGTWDASANSPALASGVGTAGQWYTVSVAGSTTIDGISTWYVNDSLVFNGNHWERIAGAAETVTSVFGYVGAVTIANFETALGYTPYSAANPSGYISGITSGMVTTALGFTPYSNTNPSGFINGITSGMVTTALGYTPYNATNPNGYINGITSSMVTTALGYTPQPQLSGTGFVKASGTTITYDNSTYLTTSSAASTYQPLMANLTSLAALSYASTSFVKMTAAGTFALDTNTYLTTSSASSTYAPIAQTMYIGTTAVAINRSSAALVLTGITSIDGNAATATNIAAGTTTLASNVVTSSLTTVGTIGTGTWQGTKVAPGYGGTGVANNAASTITISGAYALTLTLSNTTTVTLPVSGTLATTAQAITTFTTTGASGTATYSSGTLNIPQYTLSGLGGEPALGNPGTSGYLLSSTIAGVRSWVAPYSLPPATTSALGGVIVPAVGTSGLTNSSGTIGIATATASQLGGVTVGSNITVTSGSISLTSGNVTGALGFTPLSAAASTLPASFLASSLTSVGTLASLTVTATITGSVSGNAGTVTNATLTTALTVNTGAVTIQGASGAVIACAAGTTTLVTGTMITSSTTTLSSLATVGTITSGTWSASFGSVSGANLTSLTAANISNGNLGSGVNSYFTLGSGTYYLTGVTGNTAGNYAEATLSGLSFVTSTGTLSASVFSGAGTSLTGTASSLTAGHVTNATLTTALTVNTGAVTLVGNSSGSSLTLPVSLTLPTSVAGAVVYGSSMTAFAMSAAAASAGLALLSGTSGTGQPTWSAAALSLSTALTVNTGAVTLVGNSAGSTLTLQSGSNSLGTAAYQATSAFQAASSALTSVAGLTYSSSTPYVVMTAAGTFGLTALPTATTSALGLVEIGTNISVSSGTISVATGSSSTLGVVKVDNTTITASSGTISASLSGLGGLALTGGTMTGALVLATGTASLAPVKMVAGPVLTTATAGVFEFSTATVTTGALSFTDNTPTRHTIPFATTPYSLNFTIAANTTITLPTTLTLPTSVAGGVLYGSSTTAYGIMSAGTSGQVLLSGGAGSPTWSTGTLTLNVGLTVSTNAGTIAFSAASSTLTVAATASVSGTNTGDVTLAANTGLAFSSGQTGLALGTPSTITTSTTNSVTTSTHTHALTLPTNLSSLNGLSYSSLSFVKMSASGTFSLDTNQYLAQTAATGVVSVNATSLYAASSALLLINTSSTALSGGANIFEISVTGAQASTVASILGAYVSVSATNVAANFGLYVNVSGATNNYAYYGVAGSMYNSGQVGFGQAPTAGSGYELTVLGQTQLETTIASSPGTLDGGQNLALYNNTYLAGASFSVSDYRFMTFGIAQTTNNPYIRTLGTLELTGSVLVDGNLTVNGTLTGSVSIIGGVYSTVSFVATIGNAGTLYTASAGQCGLAFVTGNAGCGVYEMYLWSYNGSSGLQYWKFAGSTAHITMTGAAIGWNTTGDGPMTFTLVRFS